MKFLFRQTLGVVFAGFVLVSVQAQPRNPSVGYVHPAGGQRGTKITIEIAGQNLRRVESVQVSGGGVKVLSVRTGAAFTQRLRNHFRAIRDQRTNAVNTLKAKRAEALKAAGTMEEEAEGMTMEGAAAKAAAEEEEAKKKKGGMRAQREPLPLRHLAFPKLESMKMWELRRVSMMFTPPTAPQINRQISECALVEIEIAPDAKPGDRELRIFTARGVSNPMCFQVGTIPEVHEIEPNNTKAPDGPPQKTPFLLNGQILPGDIDRLRFEARKGQKLVVQTFARHLVPFLADAVPGWFQATVALYDEKGREVAYADDFRFDPDPVLLYDVPATGVYELEIRDSIYRGREDFVYRISVGELPFITRMFPLGG
ncbi:MAG: hypothetical protein KAI66_04470, partial [Lentisphaeria bacterium]|nr:hypothetical protein [Lentisphaeria bacterium]